MRTVNSHYLCNWTVHTVRTVNNTMPPTVLHTVTSVLENMVPLWAGLFGLTEVTSDHSRPPPTVIRVWVICEM